jgi:enoyl-[acyl-carrier protein] reductase II
MILFKEGAIMLRTEICDLLGIELPIIQGGMAWIATAELAAAVSEAGGLGMIAAGNAPAEVVREEILKARQLTNKPFGVNVMLMSEHVDAVMKEILELRVSVITTGAGNPGKYLPDLKAAGIKVIPVVNSASLAKRLERAGVDAIIAEGMEAGGHVGTETTMVLVPYLVDTVNIPVIAAGGIVDGRGMAAAFMLGAKGVQMGTRFLCAEECIVHPKYKEAVINAADRDTCVTGARTGHPVRTLKNKLARRFRQLEESGASVEELENLGRGKLYAAARLGDVEEGSVMAGQGAALVKKIQPAREILREVAEEAEKLLAGCSVPVVG